MTIGVLTTSFPRFAGDFAGCFVEDSVRRLAATGAAVEVIAAGQTDAARAEVEGRPDLGPSVAVRRIKVTARDAGTPLFYGPGAPEALEQGGIAVWGQAATFWAGLCCALRARASSWDRIEAHWLVPCALAARAVVPRVPLVAHAHSGDVALLERLPGGATLARMLAWNRSDILFASSDLRGRFARLAGIPLEDAGVVASVDRSHVRGPTALVREDARRALHMQGRTLLSVGRLVPIKGFDVLVRAVAVASARDRAPATVVILGDGPERARLEGLAHRLKVDLRLPGFVPRADVAQWMAGADLYVQPSRRLSSGRTEGLPVATLEALSAGLPVVASATGGLAELSQPAPHLRLVAPDDHGALAACLVA